jgi:hypothetical protein
MPPTTQVVFKERGAEMTILSITRQDIPPPYAMSCEFRAMLAVPDPVIEYLALCTEFRRTSANLVVIADQVSLTVNAIL